MNLAAVYHEAKSRFAYAFDRETVHLRLRTSRGDVPGVTLVGGDPFRWLPSESDPAHWEWDRKAASFVAMRLEYSTAQHDYWFAEVKPHWLRLRYAFILEKGAERLLYGARAFYDLRLHPELEFNTFLYFNFPFLNQEDVFTAPAWVRDTVWYQIFPERFADGDPTNNPPGSLAWEAAGDENVRTFFGGDLQGILNHLDDLKELGISGLYLTPIFNSPSSHKYDTTDYYQIDPAFGTNELFGRLVEAAHARGMKVMLDAVFNHCGWNHPFWQDVLRNGRKSKYAGCFFIQDEPVVNFELVEGRPRHLAPEMAGKLNYRTFAFTPQMPKWNTAHPLAREHLLGAIRYWSETYQVDGWRLDVSNEVPYEFWREFRQLVKGINPEIYILGENWDDSYPWLAGDQFDGVMNYEITTAIWNLLGEGREVQQHFDTREFQEALSLFLSSYPKNVLPNMYNMLDSHDTARIHAVCGGRRDKVRLAFALLMSLGGAPSITYGSEVGLAGDHGHNRAPMPWDPAHQDRELRSLVQRLIALRAAHPALRAADLTWLGADPQANTLICAKEAGGEQIVLLANASGTSRKLVLPVELAGLRLVDLLSGREVDEDQTLDLLPYGFRLLQVEPQGIFSINGGK